MGVKVPLQMFFSFLDNYPVDNPNINTNVTFKIVQRKETRVVVVMDVSGSMVRVSVRIVLEKPHKRVHINHQ